VQVTAFSVPDRPGWRWRLVNYSGEMVEESHQTFPTIGEAVADGKTRLAQMDGVDRSKPLSAYRPNPHLRRR
jgi:hypothetical protein